MNTLNWDDILYDLANNRAVLLIGHDLLPHQGESVYNDLYQKLIQNSPHGIDYYYPSEGFFCLKSLNSRCKRNVKPVNFSENFN